MKAPTKLTGASALTRWLNMLLGYVRSLQIVEGPNYSVSRSPRGTVLRIGPGAAGGGGTYKTFKLCRNGQSIEVEIDSKQDPSTVEAE